MKLAKLLKTHEKDELPIMPPADVAVKLANTLGVSVEFLVTGKNDEHHQKAKYLEHLFEKLPDDIQDKLIELAKSILNKSL